MLPEPDYLIFIFKFTYAEEASHFQIFGRAGTVS